ncbi:hypothetical protein [Amycolatopsis vastitatis]|uniref:DUF4386 domain-containing protein n=1 Tax=Amycolatopsis vastitatis TaxID=1905142 RepID=A0A229TBA7_9PSEU|nr:hypothetical protein [Amycolatopsis vastitatis]OXM68537.1 hypothetical protein CF165_13660 [Amycolatopsis vastitatis]
MGAIVFLVAYLSVSFVGGALSDRSLPLPDAPAADVAAYYSANLAAAVVVALLQAVSVLGFAGFARAIVRVSTAEPAKARLLAGTAGISVMAMLVSCALSLTLAINAASASSTTVQTLRLGSFYAGGVANVATLGLFVLAAASVLARGRFLGAPSRWFGYVAGTLATLSVLSLAFSYATALLPIGRILSMVWTVVVAIVLARGQRPEPEQSDGTVPQRAWQDGTIHPN